MMPRGMQGGMPPGAMQGGMMPGMPGQMMPGADGEMGGMPFVGPRIDARGLTARPDWPEEEQNYRVEVTVRDRSGKKDEVKASLIVKVRAG
jgi:hypothetical protein